MTGVELLEDREAMACSQEQGLSHQRNLFTNWQVRIAVFKMSFKGPDGIFRTFNRGINTILQTLACLRVLMSKNWVS